MNNNKLIIVGNPTMAGKVDIGRELPLYVIHQVIHVQKAAP